MNDILNIPKDYPKELEYFIKRDYGSCVFKHSTLGNSPMAIKKKQECADCDIYFCKFHIEAVNKYGEVKK